MRDDQFSQSLEMLDNGCLPDPAVDAEDVLLMLAQRYAYVFPTDSTLAMLAGLGLLVEIGAGTGYWAHRLRSVGADIVAFDQAPSTGSVPTGTTCAPGHGPTSSRAIRLCCPVTLTVACFCAGRRCSRRRVIA